MPSRAISKVSLIGESRQNAQRRDVSLDSGANQQIANLALFSPHPEQRAQWLQWSAPDG